MIDLDRLYEERPVFGFYAEQLSYPEEVTLYDGVLEEYISSSHPSYQHLAAYVNLVKDKPLHELQTLYTETFDFQKDATLFMTYVKFEDSKGRGQMLARLKVLYEMFGLSMPKGELGDLLPLMCEFVEVADWQGRSKSTKELCTAACCIGGWFFSFNECLKKI